MTRSTCIRHPENEPLIVIRQWQVALCEGNTCAASLLSFFEYWHCIKSEMRQKAQQANATSQRHGEEGHQDESLIQFHTVEDLERGLMGLYKADTIRKAIKFLTDRGFIERVKNPNQHYAFDRMRHFLFRVDAVADALNDYCAHRATTLAATTTTPLSLDPRKIGARHRKIVTPRRKIGEQY